MSWKRQIQAYDDDALTQLGSTGLLRRARKQLESGQVELHSDDNGQGAFTVGDQQVTLLNAPLEQSHCDCSASGVCVHIIAAVLHTREIARPSDATPPNEDTHAKSPKKGNEDTHLSEAPNEDIHLSNKKKVNEDTHPKKVSGELAAHSPEAVMKWAGKPGTRLAARLLATLSPDERRIEEKQTSLEIILDNEVRCRFILGAGLDGILCDAPVSRRKGIIAACLLHWQQQHGRPIQWPDDVLPDKADGPLSAEESVLVREVREQLKRMLDAGLMHLPQATVNALRTLAWSARGESLPRLSGLLLRFVGEIAAFQDRLAGTDSQQLFDLLTSVWVLCEGMLSADPQHMQALRGQFRRDYAAKDVGPLWSCGVYRYHSPSGAQGVSMILWDLKSREPLRLNMGRTGEGTASFNPLLLWQTVLPWAKGRSPENLNAKVMELEGARTSGDGRISQSQETILHSVEEANHFADAIAKLGFAQWDRLSEVMEAGLENEDAPMPPLIIRPREVKAFQVAEHDQRWIGWARDTNKNWLRLSAPVNEIHNERISAINELIAKAPFGLWGMVLEPRRDQDVLSLTPVAVILKNGDDWVCFNPDFEYLKLKKRLGSWLRQVLGSESKTPSDEMRPVELASVTRLLNDARELLLGAAEIGLDCRYIHREQVNLFVQTLQAAGSPRLAMILEQLGNAPTHARLVKAYHAFGLAWRKFQLVEKVQPEQSNASLNAK